MKLNSKEMTGLACIAGIAAIMITIPVCCCMTKYPEKQFICGGKTMLAAIPDIAKKYTLGIAKKVI